MLRTNSKKARANVKQYIVDNFDSEYCFECGYTDKEIAPSVDNLGEIAEAIKEAVYNEKIKHDKRRMTPYLYFVEWTQGLPSALECGYYYKSAVEILGDILEETEEERNRFSEMEAESLLTKLIHREIYC